LPSGLRSPWPPTPRSRS